MLFVSKRIIYRILVIKDFLIRYITKNEHEKPTNCYKTTTKILLINNKKKTPIKTMTINCVVILLITLI